MLSAGTPKNTPPKMLSAGTPNITPQNMRFAGTPEYLYGIVKVPDKVMAETHKKTHFADVLKALSGARIFSQRQGRQRRLTPPKMLSAGAPNITPQNMRFAGAPNITGPGIPVRYCQGTRQSYGGNTKKHALRRRAESALPSENIFVKTRKWWQNSRTSPTY